MGTPLTRALAPLHQAFRLQKTRLLLAALRPEPGDSLLDLGGGMGISGEFTDLYQRFRRVLIVNLAPIYIDPKWRSTVGVVVADGCHLPLGDTSYDWVFCNAVVEHVGPWKRQVRLADEIRRVARKGYFVATPNRFFPIDPHTMVPFYQFLPLALQRFVAPLSPGYLREFEPIHMLSARQMESLFPEASIVKLGVNPFPHNIVAYQRWPGSGASKSQNR